MFPRRTSGFSGIPHGGDTPRRVMADIFQSNLTITVNEALSLLIVKDTSVGICRETKKNIGLINLNGPSGNGGGKMRRVAI